MSTIVIGAGPAGIGAALALGERATVLERAASSGGLAGTIELDGAVFDLGGHSFHTPHPEIREVVFKALPMEEQERQAWCYVKDEWIPYPFQKHFDRSADPAMVAECRAGLERARPDGEAHNLDEHIERRYGAGIARHFLRPYNEKLWGRDLTRLAVDWTGERIASASGGESATQGQRTPLQADSQVAYPARGGYGEIFRALARRLPGVRFGQSVDAIDLKARKLTTSSGERLPWTTLVSTLPLPALLELLPEAPEPLRRSVGKLVALPLRLVLLTLDTRIDSTMQRVYCAGEDFPGHKVVLNHNSSAYLRSLPRHGILVEVSGADARRRTTADELRNHVVEGLRRMKLLPEGARITSARVLEVEFGYPVPTHDRAAIVEEARAWLAQRGIHTVGRFGEWAYINADEALYRGMRLGEALAR